MRRRISTWEIPRCTFHALACCCKLRAFGSFFDQSRHRVGPRDIDRMASLDLNHLGTGSLRHESLEFRSDHVIFCGQQIPARLRLPGSRCGPAARGRKSPRHLGIGHEICNLGLYVSGEGCCKLLAVKKQEAVLWRQNRGSRCIRRSSLDERKDGITGVSSECTYVNKPG